MKTCLLALLTLTIAFEASAQDRRGGNRSSGRPTVSDHRTSTPSRNTVRNTPSRTVVDRRGPAPSRVIVRDHRRPSPGRVIVRDHRSPRVVVRVQPRYIRNQYSRRVFRTVVRPPIVWRTQFGYACTAYGQLMLNGSVIHNFQWAEECQQAVQDIQVYGDFCDKEDLYDQTGIMEAQFSFDYECRDALGYYY